MSVKIFGSTGIEFSDSNQEIKIKGPTQTFSLKATTDDEFTVYNAANKLWGMSSAGLESKPNIPLCSAYFNANINYNDSKDPIVFNTIRYNDGNHYNNTTGFFTAPIDGYYLLNSWVMLMGESTFNYIFLAPRVNNSNTYEFMVQQPKGNYDTFGGSLIRKLIAGDTLSVTVFGSGWDAGYIRGGSTMNLFECHLIG